MGDSMEKLIRVRKRLCPVRLEHSRVLDDTVIEQIEEKDRFLSYPYESMKPFLRLLKEAGNNENVV